MKNNILFIFLFTFFLSFTNLAEDQNYLYSEVENLSVRIEPDLDSKRIAKLKEGERVTDLGRTSRNEISVKLRGNRTSGPFHLIRTRKGIEGWAYSRALSNRPVYVEDFIEIIAFSKYNQIDSRVKSTIRQIVDDCPKSFRDYILINYKFLTRNFEEVIIKNDNGEIIGSENISRLVDKYKNGVVILQKGSEPYYIDLVPQNPRVGDKWESVDLYCTIAAKLRCDCWD
jgi:hypothetical protein